MLRLRRWMGVLPVLLSTACGGSTEVTDTSTSGDAESPLSAVAETGRRELAGLQCPTHVLRVEGGIPHIYASDRADLARVFGFVQAQDRFFSMDLARRLGLGEVSSLLGDSALETDRDSRATGMTAVADAIMASLTPEHAALMDAYAEGINAYIELIGKNPALMPPEFDLLDYAPARWEPSDVVRIRSHGISQNVGSEVRRARIACLAGLYLTLGAHPTLAFTVQAGFAIFLLEYINYIRHYGLHREIGDRQGAARATGNLGTVLHSQGRLSEAQEHYERHLAFSREIGDRQDEANATGNLGAVLKAQGRLAEAKAHYELGLALSREIGDRHGQSVAIGNLGGRVAKQARQARRGSRYALDDLRQAIVINEILSPPVGLRDYDERRPT